MSTHALTVASPGVSLVIPPLVTSAGRKAAQHTLEFFTARIPNAHTREAYGRAVARFCAWCDVHGVTLLGVTSPLVAAYPPHGIDAVQDAQKRRLRRLRGGLGPAGGKGEGVCMAYPPAGSASGATSWR